MSATAERASENLATSLPTERGARSRTLWSKLPDWLCVVLLIFGAAIILLPFLWMVSASFKPSADVLTYPPEIIPRHMTLDNYEYVLRDTQFLRFMRNSLIIALMSILGQAGTGSLVAYGFARFRFPGRDALFLFVLGTMMIPFHAYMIPRFWIMKELGVLDSLLAVFLPYLFGSPLYIFMFRQFYMTIPRDMDDAARVDGANSLRVYWDILFPLARPVVVTVFVIDFIAAWNSFLEPLVYLNSQSNYTVTLGLSLFKSGFGGTVQWGPMMAATALAVLPPLIVFLVAQRYIIGGISTVGLKG